MPTPQEIAEQYRRGELGEDKARAYEAAVLNGYLPAPKPTFADISRMAIGADPEAMNDLDADSIAGVWLETIGHNPSGIGYFDGNKELSGREKLKMIQNEFQPERWADVLSDYAKFKKMDREQQLAEARKFNSLLSREGIAAMANSVGENLSDVLAMQNPFGQQAIDRDQDLAISAAEQHLLQKDFMRMRSFYDDVIKSEASRQFVRAAAAGVWDDNFYQGLPADEKPFIVGAVRTFKATEKGGVLKESALAVAGGVWEIVTDSVIYPVDKGITAVLTAGELMGKDNWSKELDYIRETQADARQREAAMMRKFEERGLIGKGTVGVAQSLPLMASFFIPGPGGAAARAGNLGKLQKIIGNLPVAMATTSMAQQFEGQMIDRGVDPALAGAVALPISIINMYVEKAALDKIIGIGKAELAATAQEFILKRILKGGAKGAAQALTFESAEEIIQAYNEELATEALLGDVSLDKLNNAVAETIADIAPTMLMFAAGGAVMGGLRSMSINKYHEALVADRVYDVKMKEVYENATEEDKKALRAQIFQEWLSAPAEERETVLREYFVGNVDEAQAMFEDAAQAIPEAESEIEAKATEQFATTERAQTAVDAVRKRLVEELGLPTEIVDVLTGSADPENVGQLRDDGVIELLREAKNPEGIGNHEVLHYAVKAKKFTEAEWQKLKDSVGAAELDGMVKQYSKELASGKYTMDDVIEEAIAEKYKAFKEAPPEVKSTFRRLMDWLKKLYAVVRGAEYKTVEEIFGSIEDRLKEGAGERMKAYEARTAKAEDAKRAEAEKQAKAEEDVSEFINAIKAVADVDLQEALAMIDEDIDIEKRAIANVESTIETRKARKKDNQARLNEAQKKEVELVKAVQYLEQQEAEERAIIEDSKASAEEAAAANKRARDLAKSNRKSLHEIKELKKDIERISSEDSKNEAEMDKAEKIDEHMRRLDKVVGKGDSMKSRVFKRLHQNVLASMFKGISENNPGMVKAAVDKLIPDIGRWNKLSVSEKKAEGQRLRDQGIRYAKGERLFEFDAARHAALTLRGDALNEANVQSILDRFGIKAEAASVLAEAKDIQRVAQEEFGKSVGDVLTWADVMKASIRRKITKELAQIRRTGVMEGALKERVQARLKAKSKEAQVKAKAAAKLAEMNTQEERLRKAGIPLAGLAAKVVRELGVDTSSADAMVDGLVDEINRRLTDSGENVSTHAFATTLRASLGKALRIAMNASVPQSKRGNLSKKISDFQDQRESDSINRVADSFKKLHGEVMAVAEKGRVFDVRARFQKLIKSLGTKRNKAVKEELGKRTVTPADMAVFKVISRIANMDGDAVKSWLDLGSNLLDLDESDKGKKAEEMRAEILKAFPELKKFEFSDVELGRIMFESASKYGNFAGMSEAQALDAYDNLLDEMSNAMEALAQRLFKRRETIKRVKEGLLEVIQWRLDNIGPASGDFSGFDYADPFIIIDELFLNLPEDHPGRAIQAELKDNINRARRNVSARIAEFNKELISTMEDIYTDKELREINKDREEYAKYDIRHQPVSKRSLMLTVLNLRQPDVQERAAKAPNSELAKQVKQLDELEALMDAKDRKFMDWMVQRIDQEYKDVAAKYKEITGNVLPKVELYFPLSQYDEQGNGLDTMHGAGIGIIKGFLHKRVYSTRRITTDADVVGRLSKHMDDVYRFLEYSDVQMKLRDTLFSRAVKEKLQDAWGRDNMDKLRASIITELMGKPEIKGDNIKALNAAMTLMVHMALSGNIFSAFKQLADVVSVGARMGASYANYLLNPAEMKASVDVTRELFYHPKVQAMIAEGGAPQYQTQMRGFLANLGRSGAAKAFRNIMGVVPAADKLSRLIAFGPAFRAAMEMDDIRSVEDMNERRELAIDRAILTLEQTLQSPHVADRPKSARQAGSLGKLLTMFTSALTPKIAQTLQQFRRLKDSGFKDKAAQKAVMQKLLYYHVLGGSLQFSVAYMTGLLLGDDEDWWDKQDTAMLALNLAMGPFSGMYVFGPMIEAVLKGAMHQPTYSRDPLGILSQSTRGVAETLYKYGSAVLGEGDIEEANKKAMRTLSKMTAPGRLAKDVYDKIID